jgi:DNA-binding response OmpR family regulator
MTRLLIVEDNRQIAEGLRRNFELEGYEVRVSPDGEDGVRRTDEWQPEVAILDLMLPRLDGFQVLQSIRAKGLSLPVLVLSARGGEAEKVKALRSGADDYVVKPFGLLELLARVEALLRRPATAVDPLRSAMGERYRFSSIEVHPATRTITRDRRPVSLRPKEFDLLVALLRGNGAVLSRRELLDQVWRYDQSTVTRTVDSHIAALRSKLENDPDQPRHILTAWKAGYRLRTSPAPEEASFQ